MDYGTLQQVDSSVLSVLQVSVIIHEEKYGGITLFIQDRKLWFNFILVAWIV